MRQPRLPFNSKVLQHGTLYAYKFKACRCLLCVEGMRRYFKNYREERKAEGRPIGKGSTYVPTGRPPGRPVKPKELSEVEAWSKPSR